MGRDPQLLDDMLDFYPVDVGDEDRDAGWWRPQVTDKTLAKALPANGVRAASARIIGAPA